MSVVTAQAESKWVIYGLRLEGDMEYRYVGQTRLGVAARLQAHVRCVRGNYRAHFPVYVWMRKHGTTTVVADVLGAVDAGDAAALNALECQWMATLSGAGADLLNCVAGGGGGKSRVNADQTQKIRAGSGKDHYNYGKHHSSETRSRLSASRVARVPDSQDSRLRRSKRWTGGQNPLSKLNNEDVLSIRKMWIDGATGVSIAALYGVTPANVSSIVKRKTWKHLAASLDAQENTPS